MPKVFCDVGFYQGKALDYYAPLMDADWTVYAFEPNIELPVEENIERFPFQVNWIKKAVWTEDGEVDFRIGGRDDSSHINGLRRSTDRKVTVPCIDFSKFVSELPKGKLVVSMDCEGAEFPVLEKMLAEGTAQKIDLLDIEFHHRLLDKPNSEASALRRKLEGEGILVKTKVDI